MPKAVMIIAVVFAALAVSGCGEGKSKRGLNYFPDMYNSPGLKSQEALQKEAELDDQGNVVTPATDIPAMVPPVAGTVSRDFNPYDLPDTPEGLELAKQLSNPAAPTREVLMRGQERFNIYCAVCHGKDGNVANSYVAGEGRVQGIVSINTDSVAAMPDGQIYHIITNGRGRMPHYRAQLLPEDRWSVIHYLRALHTAVAAKGDALQELEQIQDEAQERFRQLPEPVPEYEQGQWPAKIRPEAAQ
ncbi:MAG: cytochrome c [Planctomycetota bacterium]|jgi:mono/diheme cytochrome c family protein|nr:cytochrome c [Planctomycetota bacterium]